MTPTQNRASEQLFRSKVDNWIAVLLIGDMLLVLLACGVVLWEAEPAIWWILLPLLLLGIGLPAWLLRTTDYRLIDDQLVVRSGPFRWRIALGSIRKISPTRNPLSSPALSLDRLRIDYDEGKWIMISPRERTDFLQQLSARGVAAARFDDRA